MARPVRTATINGRRYNIVFAYEYDGWCDAYAINPHKERDIVINAPPGSTKALEIICHEVLHGSNWKASEESVERTARDLARLLRRLGYKRE
jgi:hypothetical protein